MNAHPWIAGVLLAATVSSCRSAGGGIHVVPSVHHPGEGERALLSVPFDGVHPQRRLGRPIRAADGRRYWPTLYVGDESGHDDRALFLAVDDAFLLAWVEDLYQWGVADSANPEFSDGSPLAIVQTQGVHGRFFAATELCRTPMGGVLFAPDAEERGGLEPGNRLFDAEDPTSRAVLRESEPIRRPGVRVRAELGRGRIVLHDGPLAWFEIDADERKVELAVQTFVAGLPIAESELIWWRSDPDGDGLRQSLLQLLSLDTIFPAAGGTFVASFEDPGSKALLDRRTVSLRGTVFERIQIAEDLRDAVLALPESTTNLRLRCETTIQPSSHPQLPSVAGRREQILR